MKTLRPVPVRARLAGWLLPLLAASSLAAAPASDPLNPGSDDTPAPVPRAVPGAGTVKNEADADQYFHLGEAYTVNNVWLYFKAYAGELDKRFADFKALARKAGAPDAVTDDIDHQSRSIRKMPWSKPWGDWNEDERKAWDNGGLQIDTWKKWLGAAPYDKLFFFYLGRDTMTAWYDIEKDITSGNNTVEAKTKYIKDYLDAFHTLATDDGYAHARGLLTPEALKALQEISALGAAADDPLGGSGGSGGAITKETVTKMGAASRTLRDLARSGKLLAL